MHNKKYQTYWRIALKMKTKDIPFDYLKIEQIDKAPKIRGLYALADSNKNIIYIGKSKNIRKRLIEHKRKKIIPFEYFIWYPYNLNRFKHHVFLLESKEQKFITKYKPPYNKQSKNTKWLGRTCGEYVINFGFMLLF